MKQKDIIQLTIAMVVLVAAGFLIYSIVGPKNKSASKGITYEVVTPIKGDFDQTALAKLSDSSVARDFYTKPDLRSGIGNPLPFNPLR